MSTPIARNLQNKVIQLNILKRLLTTSQVSCQQDAKVVTQETQEQVEDQKKTK